MTEPFSLRMDKAQVEAFWSKVAITDSKLDCWEWQGAKKPKGYGNCTINSQSVAAH